jgi:hypothetical protein
MNENVTESAIQVATQEQDDIFFIEEMDVADAATVMVHRSLHPGVTSASSQRTCRALCVYG